MTVSTAKALSVRPDLGGNKVIFQKMSNSIDRENLNILQERVSFAEKFDTTSLGGEKKIMVVLAQIGLDLLMERSASLEVEPDDLDEPIPPSTVRQMFGGICQSTLKVYEKQYGFGPKSGTGRGQKYSRKEIQNIVDQILKSEAET